MVKNQKCHNYRTPSRDVKIDCGTISDGARGYVNHLLYQRRKAVKGKYKYGNIKN